MKPAALFLAVLLVSTLACRRPPSRPTAATASPATEARETQIVSSPGRTRSDGPVIGEYAVQYDGRAELRVEASLAGVGRTFSVENGAERFVEDFEIASNSLGARWEPGTREGRSFVAERCSASACKIRYRYRLREAARALDDLSIASEEGLVIEAPASTWLLAPAEASRDARVRFRVEATSDTSFHTGVLRSRDAAGAWDIALGDLWTAPYSVFGPVRGRQVEAGTRLDVVIAPGKLTVADEDVFAWTGGAARAVAGYFGRFPLSEALVVFVPSRGRWIGEGKTLSGGGGAIFVRLGESAPPRALREDWVLVHEMTHLAFPSVAREHDWAEEGLATYVEPIARTRAGLLSAEAGWSGLVESLPKGLPAAGDRGLDRTPTWGRVYWGGALFYLLADVEIRKRTKNAFGLEHALRGILAAGGDNTHRWALDDAFAAGDAATGVPVLRELHRAMGTSPHPVDLDALWRELGIAIAHATVRFDDAAPLAAIRRAIMTAD